jgi:hypothetical protein
MTFTSAIQDLLCLFKESRAHLGELVYEAPSNPVHRKHLALTFLLLGEIYFHNMPNGKRIIHSGFDVTSNGWVVDKWTP